MKKWMVLSLAMVISVAANAQKIKVSYDQRADFAQFKTFGWGQLDPTTRVFLEADIRGAIEDELTSRGLAKVAPDATPALLIKLYGAVDQESTFYSNDPLYMGTGGIPPFDPSFSGPAFTGDWGNTTVTIQKGQLVVDLIDFANKKLVWRGMAQQNLATDNPGKLLSQVNNAITKMFKKYPAKAGS